MRLFNPPPAPESLVTPFLIADVVYGTGENSAGKEQTPPVEDLDADYDPDLYAGFEYPGRQAADFETVDGDDEHDDAPDTGDGNAGGSDGPSGDDQHDGV